MTALRGGCVDCYEIRWRGELENLAVVRPAADFMRHATRRHITVARRQGHLAAEAKSLSVQSWHPAEVRHRRDFSGKIVSVDTLRFDRSRMGASHEAAIGNKQTAATRRERERERAHPAAIRHRFGRPRHRSRGCGVLAARHGGGRFRRGDQGMEIEQGRASQAQAVDRFRAIQDGRLQGAASCGTPRGSRRPTRRAS